MWAVIIAVLFLLSLLCIRFLTGRLMRFEFIQTLAGGSTGGAAALSLGIVIAVAALLYFTLGAWNTAVALLFLLLFWLLCDAVSALICKVTGLCPARYYAGLAALVLTAVYLVGAWVNAHNVRATRYQLDSAGALGLDGLRIVGFSDSHIGSVFHADTFEKYIEDMNACEPDLAVIAGDFVDDDTGYEDMVKSCEALGKLKTACGVYYVFGNHDKGYFESSRGYDAAELKRQLEKNGVIVLEDEAVSIAGSVSLIGRQDTQTRSRLSAQELTAQCGDGYIIMLDHEPNDYDSEAHSGADLVISGHTHGGQFFSLRPLVKLLGKNDSLYGQQKRGSTDFIVSSGIADWTLKFRTGCISEYFVIDIR